MNNNQKSLSSKKPNPRIGFINNVVKSTKGFWKKYFPDKQKKESQREEIDEADWWKWTHQLNQYENYFNFRTNFTTDS